MKKTIVVVAYHFNFEDLLELNDEAPIIVQVRPVAQTLIVVAPAALPRETFVVETVRDDNKCFFRIKHDFYFFNM